MGETKKRDYAFWGLRRPKIKCGELVDENRQVAELPEIGAYVIVHECMIYEDTTVSKQTITAYRPDRNFFDAWGHPAAFRVVAYSKGREAALDKDNRIHLERRGRNGYVLRTSVKAVNVAIGAILLKEVEHEEDAKNYRAKYYGYKNGIVRETTEDLMKQAIMRSRRCCEAAS